MNIGIDVDGVLVDMEGYQLNHGTEYFSKVLGKEVVNPKAYDIEQIFSCTHAEREKFWRKYIWGYCLTEPPIKEAPQTISKLHNDGHKIFLITGRAHTTENGITGKLFRWMLKYWLKKNHIFYNHIIFCSAKDSSTNKLDICIKNKIDVMIDDKPENLYTLIEKFKVICYPAIWNEDIVDDSFIRVSDWNQIYDCISKIKE